MGGFQPQSALADAELEILGGMIAAVRFRAKLKEIDRCLDCIWRFWSMVAGGERLTESAIDRFTVERLQGRNPGLSANVREEIRWPFANGSLLASSSGEKDRADVVEAALSAENIILCFKTFFEDAGRFCLVVFWIH